MKSVIFEFMVPTSTKSKLHYVKSNLDADITAAAYQLMIGDTVVSVKEYCDADAPEAQDLVLDCTIEKH